MRGVRGEPVQWASVVSHSFVYVRVHSQRDLHHLEKFLLLVETLLVDTRQYPVD